MAVAQYVYFACGLRATELVSFGCLYLSDNYLSK
jgi:hypothetical protein